MWSGARVIAKLEKIEARLDTQEEATDSLSPEGRLPKDPMVNLRSILRLYSGWG